MNLSTADLRNYWTEFRETWWSYRYMFQFVGKRISRINVKKATGIDGISPKLLHFAKPVITKPLTNIVNLAIT
jgi:hypothetical protein